MKEINGQSLEELEALYESLLAGCDDPEGFSFGNMDEDLEDYFHLIEGVCPLERLLTALTPSQKLGLVEEYGDLGEIDFEDASHLSKLKERIANKDTLSFRLAHVTGEARTLFSSLAATSEETTHLSSKEVRSLLIFMKAGLLGCFQKEDHRVAFVPEEVKAIYSTLSLPEVEEQGEKVLSFYHFALSAVNLYGILSLEELVSIYTHYHPEETDASLLQTQFETTLIEFMPSILELELFEGCVMAEHFVGTLEDRTQLLMDQKGKPRYLPETLTEYLRYHDELYVRPTLEQKNMKAFFARVAGDQEGFTPEQLEELMLSISFEQKFSLPVENTLRTIGDMGFMPKTKELQEEMLDLLIPMDGFARKWEHKGHSTNELYLMEGSVMPPPLPNRPMLTPNGSLPSKNGTCPCGSGKKYKRCCMN